jgi:hypothetical protein
MRHSTLGIVKPRGADPGDCRFSPLYYWLHHGKLRHQPFVKWTEQGVSGINFSYTISHYDHYHHHHHHHHAIPRCLHCSPPLSGCQRRTWRAYGAPLPALLLILSTPEEVTMQTLREAVQLRDTPLENVCPRTHTHTHTHAHTHTQ